MHLRTLIGGGIAALLATACSDSTGVHNTKTSNWSGAVITVAATNPNAKGELRGVVVDSSSLHDLSNATPIAGATVVLNLKVTVQPTGPNDTAWTTVTKVGEVVTDANGRFLVTSIAEGDYYLVATPPANDPFFSNSIWAFASSGSNSSDVVIYLPRKLDTPPPDSTLLPPPTDSSGTGPVAPPPSPPPVDSM
jgi:hypothetical protein